MTSILLEACVDSVASAIAAQAGGARRVELCAALSEGGITPSAATIELTRKAVEIDLNVMIRPRAGDFCYSDLEYDVMLRDLTVARSLGADGVVVGILAADGSVDIGRMAKFISAARPMSVTFHRAFDMVPDHRVALMNLVELGVDRLLTSGLEGSALEGVDLIADLVSRAQGRLAVMAGGGVNERNVARIVLMTGVTEVHMSARRVEESPMIFRNARVHMGAGLYPPEYTHLVTSQDRIRAGLDSLRSAGL